ncbi:TolC family protein [Sphingomonas sp. A2-49]|uniref:TolC family protein n=1 Tax=Sphingomonas sp. A2-49 TaxID=1391375 RepID=UPI0021D0DEDB|nr:TolC family protein [Sphingomonas sp. A2-49]MCU6453352.1 TolC family protein [Sphingomonas sp. A2-49]
MQRFIAALMAAASCAGIAHAQTAPLSGVPMAAPAGGDVVTLESALAQGGAASPSIEASTAGVRAATAARSVAGLRPNPEIQATTENVAGTGVYKGLRSSETTVGVALPLELGGKRSARVALANARLTRAEIQSAIAIADLRLRITQLYVEAAAAERRTEVLGEQATIAANALRIASERVRAGAASPIEQQRADVLRINAQVAADSATRQAQAARSNLAALTGAPITGSLDRGWFDQVASLYGPAQPVDVEGTLAFVAATADVRTADAQVRLARTLRVPDITISAGARRLEQTNDTAAVIGVSIPIPIFNNGRAFVSQARAEQTQAQALRNLVVLDTRQEIARAQTELANAAATARATGGPALSAAAESARIARVGYSQGKFDQIALLDAERTLSQTRQSYVDALAAYHDAEARLQRLTTPAPLAGER